ncbi:MAG: type II secretion system protein [Candidatus Omnitrophota bacterium]
MLLLKSRKSFTLMELLTVAIIIGVTAAVAIPNYNVAVQRSQERSAAMNLLAAKSAQEIYRSEHGEFWPTLAYVCSSGCNAQEINQNLRLSLPTIGSTAYTCFDMNGGPYWCEATSAAPAWTLQSRGNINAGWPRCSAGTCELCQPNCPTP